MVEVYVPQTPCLPSSGASPCRRFEFLGNPSLAMWLALADGKKKKENKWHITSKNKFKSQAGLSSSLFPYLAMSSQRVPCQYGFPGEEDLQQNRGQAITDM